MSYTKYYKDAHDTAGKVLSGPESPRVRIILHCHYCTNSYVLVLLHHDQSILPLFPEKPACLAWCTLALSALRLCMYSSCLLSPYVLGLLVIVPPMI